MGQPEMPTIDKMSEGQLAQLRTDLNKPMTGEYKNNFCAKKYHNENILNKNRKRHYYEDAEFCKYYNISFTG